MVPLVGETLGRRQPPLKLLRRTSLEVLGGQGIVSDLLVQHIQPGVHVHVFAVLGRRELLPVHLPQTLQVGVGTRAHHVGEVLLA